MAVHPLFVHFPIALLLVGTLAIVWNILRPASFAGNSMAFEGFVSGVMGLGYAGLILTLVTGLFDMQASPKALAREGWLTFAVIHIISAGLMLITYSILLYRRFVLLPPATDSIPQPPDRISLVLAIVGLILLVVSSWLGGTLVYHFRIGVEASMILLNHVTGLTSVLPTV